MKLKLIESEESDEGERENGEMGKWVEEMR